jgi:osmotically-inducible protein OsmY
LLRGLRVWECCTVTRLRSVLAVLAVAACCPALEGCVVAVVGGAAGGGYVLGQERGAGATLTDAAIKTEINARWLDTNRAIASYVDLNVFDGRVLLTGEVPDPLLRDQAVAEAWKTDGVKEVINEIQLGDSADVGSTATDNWIQTRLRTELTFDGNVNSLNYTIETVNGVVYILGSARSQDELDRVLNHARNLADVRRVVNYVRIRPGAGEQPVPAEASSAPAPFVQDAAPPDLDTPPEPDMAPLDAPPPPARTGAPIKISPLP